MTEINSVTTLTRDGDIAVITLNSPPVNALSAKVREGLFEGFKAAGASDAKAIVLICEGRTFIAGADITEFGGAMAGPSLFDVQDMMENSPKPVVAAIHGTALGGGLEVALCAHYRVAVPSARVGLPEVALGLLPGAGGTQRLPRIVGVEAALDMVTSGRHVPAKQALAMGLVDELVEEGKLLEGALAFARKAVAENKPLVKVRDNNAKLEAAKGHPEIFADFRKANARKFRGFAAPEANIKCVEAAVNSASFEEGLKAERKLFGELMMGAQSAAQRYYFFAERQANKIPDVPDDTPIRPIKKVGILGAGTMGGGIAMNFLNAGIPVTIVEVQEAALARGLDVIRKNYERSRTAKPEETERRMALLEGSLDFDKLADCDLIIEAVFERMDIKKDVFARLDKIAKPGAILASNTSYLNVDEIAASISRPGDVVGMHFFSPANVMKLLEVVRGAKTAPDVLLTAMQIGKKIRKVPVVAGVCHGFIGNRMLMPRQIEATKLLLEGASPEQIDRVHVEFGMPMGPFQMADLAGVDIGWHRDTNRIENIRDALCAIDRWGQKKGAGFYDYDDKRKPSPSPVVQQIIEDFAKQQGVERREISDQEIVERTLYTMVNEGAKILEEGIAQRASDIDVVWVYGYGWPVYRGGPMCWADSEGLGKIVEGLKRQEARMQPEFNFSKLLLEKAGKGESFTR
jgi:3-hydroxyacyl-CoA dehydrogenase